VALSPEHDIILSNLIKSLFDLLVFWIIYSAIVPVAEIMQRTSTGTVTDTTRKVAVDLTKTLVAVLGILSALQFWGINVAGFIAGLGLVGAAIALAAKDTFSNLFASIVMYMDHAFSKDDWILTPHVEGTVEQVGIRTTSVRAFDTSLVLVPNAMLANAKITNFNKCTLRRIVWTLPIAGDATAEQLVACVEGIRKFLRTDPRVDQGTLIVSLDKFGENCIDLFTFFFLKELRWKEFQEEKEQILLYIARIVAKAGTRFGVPTRLILQQDHSH
jgi:MscS family membrane protein